MAIIAFPREFVWGAATAAYQIEGGYDEDGRGLSIWDTFSHTPGKVYDGDTGDVACDSYHRYEEDVKLMQQLGIHAYRFSISWPRIYPNGDGELNDKGLDYYRRLVDCLLDHGITPFCTLYHWDLPQALQDKGGWNNRETIDAYVQYAETVFRAFDGKILHYMTFNEPWCASILSNYIGEHAPGNRDLQLALDIGHHILVAHGKTVQRFRALGISGQIGYAPNVHWMEPYSRRPEDVEAARRRRASMNEWFLEPVFKGSYPSFMIDWYAKMGAQVNILPGDMETIQQPIDFLGINYYTGNVVRYHEYGGDFQAEDVDMGYDRTHIGWPIYPDGLYQVLTWIHEQYDAIPIYMTENGACDNTEIGSDGKVHDELRIGYLKSHLASVNRAMHSGVPVKGYLTWSLMDNFEWAHGYSMRFGIIHVDYRTLKRTPKESYYWYQKLIRKGYLEM